MTPRAVAKFLSKTFLICAVSLGFAAMTPVTMTHSGAAWAQHGSAGGHGGGGGLSGGGHASGGGHSGGGHAFGFSGGSHGSAGKARGGGSGVNNSEGHSSGVSRFFHWFGGAHSANGGAVNANAGDAAENGGRYTRNMFVSQRSENGTSAAHENAGRIDPNAPRMILMNADAPEGGPTLNARPFAADNFLWEEPSAQQGRPTYTPPPPPQAQTPRPVTPPAIPQMPQPSRPVSNPVQNPIQTRPVTPMGQAPAQAQRPIGIPQVPQPMRPVFVPPAARAPIQPVIRQPIGSPILGEHPVHPLFTPPMPIPVRPPVAHFPGIVPPIGIRPGPPEFHPILTPPVKNPNLGGPNLFHPVLTPPGRMRFGPPLRMGIGGPFAAMTPSRPPLRFNVRPCIDTITHCGLFLGDGDFDFDDGFPFGFSFGPPFFFGFGPFGFPAFTFGFGPNCFFGGAFVPCAFTPFGFAAFQAWGPNGWGWSQIGLGNGFFYSPPQPAPPPPWNSTETTPPLNLQYFTNEWYLPVPYSEPEAPTGNPEAGAQGEQQNVVTEIVTTDGIVFGVTSYWLDNDQLCYVTTYNIKNCIPMSRVDLQKTVDMNYKRGVKFTLTPKPPDSQNEQPPQNPQSPDSLPNL